MQQIIQCSNCQGLGKINEVICSNCFGNGSYLIKDKEKFVINFPTHFDYSKKENEKNAQLIINIVLLFFTIVIILFILKIF